MKAVIFFVGLALLVSVLAGPSTGGSSSTGNGNSNGFNTAATGHLPRSVQFSLTADGEIDFRSTGRSTLQDANGDLVRFGFGWSWVPRWLLRYYRISSDYVNTVATHSARWSLWKLVEYSESGATEGFQPGVDRIVKQYQLWGQPWSKLHVNTSTEGNATVYSLCSAFDVQPISDLLNRKPIFIVEVCSYVTDTSTLVNGTESASYALKWSLLIKNFPYSSNNTHIALKVGFDTMTEVQNFTSTTTPARDDEDALLVSDEGSVTSGAVWKDSVEIAGDHCEESAAVLRSVVYKGEAAGDIDVTFPLSGDVDNIHWKQTTRIVYFSLLTTCQPELIFWDPQFGVMPNSTTNSSSSSSSPSSSSSSGSSGATSSEVTHDGSETSSSKSTSPSSTVVTAVVTASATVFTVMPVLIIAALALLL